MKNLVTLNRKSNTTPWPQNPKKNTLDKDLINLLTNVVETKIKDRSLTQ